MNHQSEKLYGGRITTVFLGLILLNVLALAFFAVQVFENVVSPELNSRSQLIASMISEDIQRTVELGIPLETLGGLDSFITSAQESFEEIQSIRILTSDGKEVASVVGEVTKGPFVGSVIDDLVGSREQALEISIISGNRIVGYVSVETNPRYIQLKLRDLLLDIAVLALVVALISVEVVKWIVSESITNPTVRIQRIIEMRLNSDYRFRIREAGLLSLRRTAYRLNDQAVYLCERVSALSKVMQEAVVASAGIKVTLPRADPLRLSFTSDIRIVFFLFVIATEIAAAFLPVLAANAQRPEWMSREVAAALPLILYLITIAATAPFSEALIRKFGAQKLFTFLTFPAALALIGLTTANSAMGIAIWRGLIAVAFGFGSIACYEYAKGAAGKQNSPLAAATFLFLTSSGVLCGSAVGGILAGRFGFDTAFNFAAAIAVISGLLARKTMRGRSGDAVAGKKTGKRIRFRSLSLRMYSQIFGLVLPLNASLAIFIWYLVPLILNAQNAGPSLIGRIVMLYYLAMILTGPLSRWLTAGWLGSNGTMILGSVIWSIAILFAALNQDVWTVTVSVAFLGVGHRIVRTPMIASFLTMTEHAEGSYGILNLFNRLGALLGLLISIFFLGSVGVVSSLQALAIIGIIGASIFGWTELRHSISIRRV